MDPIVEADESEVEINAVPSESKTIDLPENVNITRLEEGGSNPEEDPLNFTTEGGPEETLNDFSNPIEDLEADEKIEQNKNKGEEESKRSEIDGKEDFNIQDEESRKEVISRSGQDSVPPIDLESEPETGVFSTTTGRSEEKASRGLSDLGNTSNLGSQRSPKKRKRLIEMAVEDNDYESEDESSFEEGAASNIQVPLISSRLDTGVDLNFDPDETRTSPSKSVSIGRHTKLKFMDVESNDVSSDDENDLFDDKDLEIHDDVTSNNETTPRDDVTVKDDVTVVDDVIAESDDKSAVDGEDENSKLNYSQNRARTMMFSVAALKDLKRRAQQHRNEEERARELENKDKYLRNADNLRRAHAAMRENFMDLLVEKVDKDREDIRLRSAKWDEKRKQAEQSLQKERRSKVPKKTKVEVSHDQDFLDRIPKSRIYQVLRLKEEWRKEGKLKNPSDDAVFWERIKSGKNPVDEEIRNKIQARKMASAGSQAQSQNASNNVQGEETAEGSKLLIRLLEGKPKIEVPEVQAPPKTAPAKPKEEIVNQLPNLLNVPQFTKRRRSSTKPEPDPILQLFKRPEMPKLKSLENHFEDKWSKEQKELQEQKARAERAEERRRQGKRTQIMYQNAITHMAITNRLMARGFEDIAQGTTIRDLVQQDEFDPSEVPIPKSPQPKVEPITYPLFTQSKLIPIDSKEKSYLDKQYDKPSSTKRVDRRRVKQPTDADLQPFQHPTQQNSAALSLNSILPTSVVRQPNWHRAMWSNYNLIGVTNPDQQSQKWEQNKSVFGEELANSTLLA